ncbi:MAG: hydrolase TatD [Candidatus Magasanikbacteria bacterium CG_4_10_14_0_2_um_filter_37_12]|uniref:Hydrolase TatD n=1 Tax=Candidatus Magasanikbacteria bacterium CG_4_10_14_0_2_um_filter_37_12 TaxID=1974637 RepID=A0A2M7V893_9BACT|nr:MAG: hydrolase TatD [Candidatus Magasanikbacteria bacterium CG_4_10_14_0_2_um_filter_37_12]
MLIDTHCHIQFKAYNEDRDEVLKRCTEKNIILNAVGTQLSTSKLAVELAEKYDWIYASVGLHPIQEYVMQVEEEATSFLSRGEQFDYVAYKKLAEHPKVIGIGETGLDRFHMPDGVAQELVMEKQKQVFLQHAKLAAEVGKPLVVHVRDAHREMINIISNFKSARPTGGFQISNSPGVIHCFTGNWEQAGQYLDMGFYLGFTGVVTFSPKKTDPKPQEDLLEVLKKVPLNRILVETDAPYLAPQKYRGQRCEPWMVGEVVTKLAEARGMSSDEVAQITAQNAKKLFDFA